MSTGQSDEKMSVLSNFMAYLDTKRASDRNNFTHTTVGCPFGKYEIDDADTEEFMWRYCDVCAQKKDNGTQMYCLNLSEKQKNVGPLMTDYDFVFDNTHTKRSYTLNDIMYVVKCLNKLICECVDIDDDDVIAYVTEKPEPSITRETGNNKENNSPRSIKKVKDGFHICYTSPFTVEQRYMIYTRLKEMITKEDGFKNIPFTNKYDDIIDVSTIHRNNWMMYGSRKTVKEPYSMPYKLTHIFDKDLNEQDINEYEFDDLVKMFSVRQYSGKHKLVTRDEFIEYEKQIAIKYNICKTNSDVSRQLSTNDKSADKCNTHRAPMTNIEMAKKLCSLLSPERAYSEESWVSVGWALHNIDESLFDTFVEFSKKSPEKFDYNGCVSTWKHARNSGYTIASLHWWAQQDNAIGYNNMIWDNVDKKMINIETGRSVDIANMVRELYKYRFRCATINMQHNGWYEFQQHRWVHIDCASSLRNEISEYIAHKYIELGSQYMVRSGQVESDQMDTIQKKCVQLGKLGARLRDTALLNSVITECEHKFIDQQFVEDLNENSYLVGFDNGVYDLKSDEFRDGLPSDNLTFSVGYDWVDYTGDEPIFDEISTYFNKVAPNKNIREYILRQIASFVRGKNTDQQFVFWTGKGCHSGDTQILMYNGGVKCAKDVQIGDELMGDDSTPRRVKGLFSGIQDMYKVILSDGTFYMANANHRMALKLVHFEYIRYDDISMTYIVSYHKYVAGVPVKYEKYFKIAGMTKDVALNIAENYLRAKIARHKMICVGDVIPIKISDYIGLDENIKQYYCHYRNPIEFKQQQVIVDPYKIGMTVGTTQIPTQYKFNSLQIRRSVLAGILDKCGSFDGNDVYITSPNKQFMNDCVFICRSVGFHVTNVTDISIKLVGNFRNIPTKILKIFTEHANRSHQLTYDFSLNRIGKGTFYGFAVDKNERYVLQNCIVTYNSNGKSLLTDLVKRTFGDYYKPMDPTVLTRKRGNASNATPELADKNGVRIIILSEPEEDDTIYSSNMKKFTGATDDICARPLYGNEFTYVPQFKMIMVCNDLPCVLGKDDGTWRRIRVVPFEAEFVDGEPTTPYQFKKDKQLEEKMKNWPSAFMWMLIKRYYPVYCKDGLSEPSEVKLKTAKFRHDTDIFSEFIDDAYEITKDDCDRISIQEFYAAFRNWYKTAGNNVSAPSRVVVKNYIERNGKLKIIGSDIARIKQKAPTDDI